MVKNDVLFGKGDFLFLYQGKQRQFDFLLGLRVPSQDSISNFKSNLVNRLEYCKNRNIKYLHITYPSKPVVKNMELPTEFRQNLSSLYLKYYQPCLEQLQDFVHYPANKLSDGDVGFSVYRKKDTHMTDYGYAIITEYLSSFLDFEFCKKEIVYHEKILSSDLPAMLGMDPNFKEWVYSPCNEGILEDNRRFLSGNTGNVVLYYNVLLEDDKRLLVFGDSFIKDNLKFLFPYFKNILFVRSQFFFKDLVELFKPHYVITSCAERYLANVESDENPRALNPLFFPLISDGYYPSDDFNAMFSAFLSISFNNNKYLQWEKIVRDKFRLIRLGKLGVVVYNKNIHIKDLEHLEFSSLNHDPYFTVLSDDSRIGKMFLRIEMISDISSDLEIFYKKVLSDKFSENFKERIILKKGYNEFVVELDFDRISSEFRIDPIKHAGSFRFLKIELFK